MGYKAAAWRLAVPCWFQSPSHALFCQIWIGRARQTSAQFEILICPFGPQALCPIEHIVSWEPEGRYCRWKMFRWEPEGRYCYWLCTSIVPFWFSTEHLWAAITPFWLSTDDMPYLHSANQHMAQELGDHYGTTSTMPQSCSSWMSVLDSHSW